MTKYAIETNCVERKTYFPNSNGHYKETKIPKYIQAILENVHNLYDYTFELTGVNPVRPGYGLDADLEKLETWAKRYFADFQIKRVVKAPKCYYAIFEMTDPVVHQLEKAGLLKCQ